MKCKLPTEMRQKMRNWQNFINCNVPTAITEKVLHWAISNINFNNCKSLTKHSGKVQNWAYSIECTIQPTRIREKVQYSTV